MEMYKLTELNCRNFRCDSNKNGNCLQGNVELAPATETGPVDRLICVQATYTEEKKKQKIKK